MDRLDLMKLLLEEEVVFLGHDFTLDVFSDTHCSSDLFRMHIPDTLPMSWNLLYLSPKSPSHSQLFLLRCCRP